MNSLLPRYGIVPRHLGIALALLVAGSVGGCGRSTTKAIAAEAQADNLVAGGDMVRAADMLDKAVEYDGNDAGRWVKLGRARRDLGQPALAAAAFQQAFDLDPANIEAMQNLVVLYIAGRQFEAAKRIVDPLLALSPNDIAGVLATGAIAYFEERYPAANKIADEIITLAPDAKEGYVLKAHILEKTGRAAEGARLLEKRMISMPDDVDMAEQLLGLYRSIGDVQGVRSIALRLVTLKPDDPRYRLEAVRAYEAKGDIANREQMTDYIVGRYRNNPSVLGALADFWIQALPKDEATRRIAALAAGSSATAKAALASRLVRTGALDAANALLAPIAGQPVTSDTVDLHAMLAALRMAQGNVAGAREQAQMTLAFDGGNDVALLTRARAHLAGKEYDKALIDAQAITANGPDEAAALLIAETYAAQGNDVLAASAFADAQSSSPKSMSAVKARTAWLIRRRHPDQAAQIAGLFARQINTDEAWSFYEQMCRVSNDQICLAQARARGAS